MGSYIAGAYLAKFSLTGFLKTRFLLQPLRAFSQTMASKKNLMHYILTTKIRYHCGLFSHLIHK